MQNNGYQPIINNLNDKPPFKAPQPPFETPSYGEEALIYYQDKENSPMNKIEKHKNICDVLNKVYSQKNHDYGDSFGKTFRDLGLISAITRMSDKYNRIVSLAKLGKNEVADESIRDTLMDLANYCIMTIIELDLENMTVVDINSKKEEE